MLAGSHLSDLHQAWSLNLQRKSQEYTDWANQEIVKGNPQKAHLLFRQAAHFEEMAEEEEHEADYWQRQEADDFRSLRASYVALTASIQQQQQQPDELEFVITDFVNS